MNKLLLVLSGLALAGSAYAADDTQLKFNGEIRARYNNVMNAAGVKGGGQPVQNQSNWEQRSLLGFTAMKGESLTGHIKFLNAGEWGRDATTGDLTTTDISRTGQDNTVVLLESWVWWKANDMLALRWGRGGMDIADGSVVSKNEYDQVPTVFEGVLGTFDFGFSTLNVFGVKSAELEKVSTSSAYDKEANFYGFSFDFKNLPDVIKMANLHVIFENQDKGAVLNATTASPTTLSGKSYTRYGLTIGGDVSGFDFKGTYAGLTGKQRATNADNDVTVNASMMDFAAGYTLADMMSMRLGLVYHSDTGENDDNTTTDDQKKTTQYDAFHYDTHNYAGKMDIVKWGNSTYVGGNFKMAPMDKTTLGLEYLVFTRSSTKAAASFATGRVSAPGTNDKSDVGSELDFWVDHKYSDAFSTGIRIGMFTPGEYLMYSGATKTEKEGVTDAQIHATYKF